VAGSPTFQDRAARSVTYVMPPPAQSAGRSWRPRRQRGIQQYVRDRGRQPPHHHSALRTDTRGRLPAPRRRPGRPARDQLHRLHDGDFAGRGSIRIHDTPGQSGVLGLVPGRVCSGAQCPMAANSASAPWPDSISAGGPGSWCSAGDVPTQAVEGPQGAEGEHDDCQDGERQQPQG
jgi:hypothetical protein